MSTITTVGFGDPYPVTTEGRIAGVILMFVGITVVSVFTAAIASLFVERKEEESVSEPVVEVKLLREKIESFEHKFDLQR